MENIGHIPRPIEIKPLAGYRLWVRFTDGVSGEIDLSEFVGKGLFKRWGTTVPYESVFITRDHVIAWDYDLEMDADSFYLDLIGKTYEVWKESQLDYAAH